MFFNFNFSDTNFCASILSKTQMKLQDLSEKSNFEEELNVDSCCRLHHECDIRKRIELNYRNNWELRNCECEYAFRKCLGNLNTKLSIDLRFIYYLNTTKCYSNDHPIEKCLQFQTIFEPNAQYQRSINLSERNKSTTRCLRYKLAENKPKQYQIFDLPFQCYGITLEDDEGKYL